jgi:glycosyltransferase involved in cell wall biosynthesis
VLVAEPASGPGAALHLCFVGWGDHIHLERWAGYFAKRGHRVSVVSLTGAGRYPEGVIQRMIGLQTRGMRWRRLKLKYLLWRLKPDLVHAHWASYAYDVTRVWAGPAVATAYGSDIYRLDEHGDTVKRQVVEGLRRVKRITCDSKDLQQRIAMLTGRSDEDIALIQWGVDTELFSPGVPDPEFFNSVIKYERPVVFSARDFTPLYQQEVVVKAFQQVLQELPNAMLIMKYHNGLPQYRAAIEARIRESGIGHAVRIVNSIPYEQMPNLYRIANVTVSIPSSDATPMSLLEAMACGSAPVFSDVPSLREWIADGSNGYLVAPHDHGLLVRRILEVLRNPHIARTFAERNLDIVKRRANQVANMSVMESIYRRLARSSRADIMHAAQSYGAHREPEH